MYQDFINENVAPRMATKIGVYNSQGIRVGSVELGNLQQNLGQKLYSFGVISDIHLSVDTSESDLQVALTYLNNNEDVAFTCVTGDITNNGTVEQFTRFKELVAQYSANTRVYATNGNHDLYNSNFNDELWNAYVDNTRDYVFTHEQDVFIMFGITGQYDSSAFNASQRAWLEQKLTQYSSARIFLFIHPFIEGTNNGNFNNVYTNIGLNKTGTIGGKWLLDLLKANKNVILFTGHSHLKFKIQELCSTVTICNNVDNVETAYLVHIPSITMPRDVEGGVITDYLYAQSEGVVIDVYEDCIVYRGRNFVDDKFIPIAIYKLDVAQGTLPNTPVLQNYSITNNLTNCTNSNNATTVEENSSYQATITASEGYELSSVIVKMDNVDITSSVYSNGNISIANVTGNIVITATATDVATSTEITFTTTNVKLDKDSGAESTGGAYYYASDFVAMTTPAHLLSCNHSVTTNYDWNVSVVHYNANKQWVGYSNNVIGKGAGVSNATIPTVAETEFIRLRIYAGNTEILPKIKLFQQ